MEDYILMRRLRRRAWPVLLDGPVHVSARRWQQNGVAVQTLRNWAFVIAYRMGVSPQRLASIYDSSRPVARTGLATAGTGAAKERHE
jgi:hypothetical protein